MLFVLLALLQSTAAESPIVHDDRIGTGAIWIRQSRLQDIEPCMSSTIEAAGDNRRGWCALP